MDLREPPLTNSILGDTNILLRFAHPNANGHSLVFAAIELLIKSDHQIAYAPQSLREFWNVSTRPTGVNGFGHALQETDHATRLIEQHFTLLHDTDAMHETWRRLVVEHEVRGVQVHDARLAASALVGDCRAILTLNDADFRRYGVPALHPRDVSAFLGA